MKSLLRSDSLRSSNLSVSFYSFLRSALHRVPPITAGVWLLWPRLTSAHSHHKLLHDALAITKPRRGVLRFRSSNLHSFNTDRPMSRSPQIRTWSLLTQPPHLLYPSSHRILLCCANSSRGSEPYMRFLSVGSSVCSGLPSDIPSRVCPCLSLVVNGISKLQEHGLFAVCWLVSRQCRMIGSNIMKASGFPTGDLHPIRSRPCGAYTSRSRGRAVTVHLTTDIVWVVLSF